MSMFSKYIPTAPEGLPVTDIYQASAQFPGIVMDGDQLRVHYQKYAKHHDTLECGVLGEKGLEDVIAISGPGEVLYPDTVNFGGSAWYAWSETRNGG